MAIEIIDILGQKNNGEFPLVDSNDIRGGFYQVDTIEERNLIPSIRRKEGMLCAIKSDNIYQLVGGIDNSNWTVFNSGSGGGFSGEYDDLINKPYIPKNVSDLVNDSGFITIDDLDTSQNHIHGNFSTLEKITEEKITSWDNKSDFDGDYNSLTNKPEIPNIEDLATKEEVDEKISNIASEIEVEILDISNKKVDDIVLTDDNFLNFYANEVLVKSIKIEGSNVSFEEIEELKNEKIDDVVVETLEGITYIKLFANGVLLKSIEIKTSGDSLIHVGADEPTVDNCEVWIDVSDDEEFSSKIEDALVDEIRSIIGNLQGEIDKLKKIIVVHEARIEYLELNGGGSSGDSGEDDEDNDNSGGITTKFVPMVFEDGEILVFEDNTILTFEDLNY